MTLLLAEGFDTRTALATNMWNATDGGPTKLAYVAGRLGGYAMQGIGSGPTDTGGIRKAITSSTTVVVGFAMRWGAMPSAITTSPFTPVTLYSGGVVVLSMRFSSTGVVTVNRGATSATGTTLGTTSVAMPTDQATWQYIEMKVVASTGTGGSVVVRQDGVETLNITSQNTGATAFTEVGFRDGLSVNNEPYGGRASFDDIYVLNTSGSVNNDFLGDVRVYGIWPDGDGATSGLTGSDGNSTDNYLLVDDATAGAPDTADYVGSGTPGTKDTYTYTDLSALVTVKGVQVDSYVVKTDAGQISGRNVASDGTNTVTGSDVALSTSYAGRSSIMENAPDGAAWTASKVNSTQFGWEVRT